MFCQQRCSLWLGSLCGGMLVPQPLMHEDKVGYDQLVYVVEYNYNEWVVQRERY